MRFWDGRGTVQLVDLAPDVAAMLLKRIVPGTPASLLPVDECMQVMGRMMRRLGALPPRDVPPTADLAATRWMTFESDWIRLGRPFPVSVLRAAERAAIAVSVVREDLAVDGDLHPGQVLRASREPWLAVDLMLYRGDIEYNLARILVDRIDDMPSDAAVDGHFLVLVRAADLDLLPPLVHHTWL
ncbi:MAG TPA: aminoglycoside phosphotransferase family protein [Mycobacteriales bacterium]|nr:aminoglycoside phosphotransferase family protein [Mycobacteriales bacterium]